jgi:lysozyme
MKKIVITNKHIGIFIAILVLLFVLLVLRYLPSSDNEIRHSAPLIEYDYYYTLSINGKPRLYFSNLNPDSTLSNITANSKKIKNSIICATGCWINKFSLIPSCFGRIVTSFSDRDLDYEKIDIRLVIAKERRIIKKDIANLKKEKYDLDYYLNVHGVMDEGYNMIAAYANETKLKINNLKTVIALFDSIDNDTKIDINKIEKYKAIFNKDGKNRIISCRLVIKSKDHNCRILQTHNLLTPIGVRPQYIHHEFGGHNKRVFIAGYNGIIIQGRNSANNGVSIIPAYVSNDTIHGVPRILASDGSPVFDKYGYFIGITSGQRLIKLKKIKVLLYKSL